MLYSSFYAGFIIFRTGSHRQNAVYLCPMIYVVIKTDLIPPNPLFQHSIIPIPHGAQPRQSLISMTWPRRPDFQYKKRALYQSRQHRYHLVLALPQDGVGGRRENDGRSRSPYEAAGRFGRRQERHQRDIAEAGLVIPALSRLKIRELNRQGKTGRVMRFHSLVR